MNKIGFRPLPIIALAGLALVAAWPAGTGAGIDGTGTAKGRIKKFGSVWVNGVEHFTTHAQIIVDGTPSTEASLRIGQVVTIRGTVDASGVRGEADTVSYDRDLSGKVTAVDASGGTFVVLGQTVRVDGLTTFDDSFRPAGIGSLSAGMSVDVSGMVNANDELVATRIDRIDGGNPLEATGSIHGLDPAETRFSIRNLLVDYSAATQLPSSLENGVDVEVVGDRVNNDGSLRAQRIEIRHGIEVSAGELGDLQGFVTTFASPASFTVAGQPVVTDAATLTRPAGAAFGLNSLLEVKGVYDDAGHLRAAEVKVVQNPANRYYGPVEAVDPVAGTITVLGVELSVEPTTRYADKSKLQLRTLALADVHAGDFVDLRFESTGLVASLERLNFDRKVEIQGVARYVAGEPYTVSGLTVLVASGTNFNTQALKNVTGEAFLVASSGHLVSVKGKVSGGAVLAQQISIVR